jgi:vacuolar-type H+-ATPase subunit E/Vma4
MSLEKLLKKIEEDGREEINSLKKEHGVLIEKIEKEKEERITEIKDRKEEELEKERKRLLEEHEKEKEFLLKMEILGLKKKTLSKASLFCKEEIKKLSVSSKKEIFKKKTLEFEKFLDENCLVFVPSSKKKDFVEIFKKVPEKNIIEKGKVTDDEFIVEGKGFVLKVSLSDVVDEIVEKEEGLLSEILFSKK